MTDQDGTSVPFEELPWPPDLETPDSGLLVQAVGLDASMGSADLDYNVKLEILVVMMKDWHSRYNALVALLQQKDKEFSEKLQALEEREKERVEGLAELNRLREESWPRRQHGV